MLAFRLICSWFIGRLTCLVMASLFYLHEKESYTLYFFVGHSWPAVKSMDSFGNVIKESPIYIGRHKYMK